MTLIVGLLCRDGVVVGADGAASLGPAVGVYTVRQSVKKLFRVQGNMIFGVSGAVGMGQLLLDGLASVVALN